MNHSQSQKSINQVAPRSALTRSAFSSKDLQLKHNVRNQSQFNQYIESAASSYNTSQVTFKQSRPHSQYLISSTSKPNKLQEDQEQHQQQDLYLKDFQQNRRKQIEQQNKQAESLIKEMQLQKSQSTSNIGFTLKKNVQDRHIPGLKQFIAEKHSASKVWNFNQSQNQSYQSEIKQRTGKNAYNPPKDEWQMRIQLIEKLNEIQQQNKYFYGKLEDHYETEDKLRAQNYFNSNIRDKLESQNNDLPASLVALQYNRKFILDQMINRKGYFSSKDDNQNSNKIKNQNDYKRTQQHSEITSPNSQGLKLNINFNHQPYTNDLKDKQFLKHLRRQSVNKFKQQFLVKENVSMRVNEAKKMQSRSQFDNAAALFRFLPKDKRKKIQQNIKLVIDQKERQKQMESVLENCINGTEQGEEADNLNEYLDNLLSNKHNLNEMDINNEIAKDGNKPQKSTNNSRQSSAHSSIKIQNRKSQSQYNSNNKPSNFVNSRRQSIKDNDNQHQNDQQYYYQGDIGDQSTVLNKDKSRNQLNYSTQNQGDIIINTHQISLFNE
eukprot:403353999